MNRTMMIALAVWMVRTTTGLALDLVKEGVPTAVVVTTDGQMGVGIGARNATNMTAEAAKVLIDWTEKMTGARLSLTNVAPHGVPAIHIGEAAAVRGLKLDDLASDSNEGLRIVVKGQTALIGGQNGEATVRAVCRFLERLGCRYFMPAPVGEVFPRTKDLAVADFTHAEKPGLRCRRFWGSSFYKPMLWRTWNGDGGIPMNAAHSWSSFVPPNDYGQTHPEYFSLQGTQRLVNADAWLCTSNPDVRDLFVKKLLALAKENPSGSFSISPPDNRQYCQCARCRAQDDPDHREISSGAVSMTARFLDFYNAIARPVYKEYPNVTLNFYCYADYTEPPRIREKASPNLVAWIAPIRYSRYHHIGNPISPSKVFEKTVIEGWREVVGQLGYRTYNANLAEATTPFSKLLTWKHDLPFLKRNGVVAVDNESFVAWGLMGPHLYQSLRLMYDPDLDAEALMEDYFSRFYGPAEAPMKAYWMAIDDAFQNLPSESGCFYALHLVYTPERLKALQARLDEAARLAAGDETLTARVAMADKGLKMAWDYVAFRTALNQGEPARAKEIADRMLQRAIDDQFCFHNKTLEYVRRFLTRISDAAARFTAPPNRLVAVLPDEWKMRPDPDGTGREKGFHAVGADTTGWRPVNTYTATLSEQGVTGQSTFLWYRGTFTAPERVGRLLLFFCDVDGMPETTKLFVNGREIRAPGTDCSFEPNRDSKGVRSWRRREPLWAYVESAVEPGKENVVALMIDNRSISENALGGIVRPVYLIEVNQDADAL